MNQDPLAQLKDIHLPLQAESGWPALGYWLLILIAAVIIFMALFFVWRRWHKNRARRNFARELQSINIDHPDALRQLNLLLKKAALSYYPREVVAGLHGERWLAFLDSRLKPQDRGFVTDASIWLSHYQLTPQPLTLKQFQLANTWLRGAKPMHEQDLTEGGNKQRV